jgi:hypothetical protein
MAREARSVAWTHALHLPLRTRDLATAFATRHPVWTVALAAGWFLRPRRRSEPKGARSFRALLTAGLAQVLPTLLQFAGVPPPGSRFRDRGTEAASTPPV